MQCASTSWMPALSVNELLRWPGVIAEAEIGQETLQAEIVAAMSQPWMPSSIRTREGAALEAMLCRASTRWTDRPATSPH